VTVFLVLSSCGGSNEPAAQSQGSGESQGAGGEEHAVDIGQRSGFGRPGDPATADRNVEVESLDKLRFRPDSIEVGITFVVANTGKNLHSS
jgi:hypothetical protein